MNSYPQAMGTVRNDRVRFTDAERARIDALNEASFAGAMAPEGVDVLAQVRKALRRDTGEALRAAIPDLEERARAQAERWAPEFEKLKGTAWPEHAILPDLDDRVAAPVGSLGGLLNGGPTVILPTDPHRMSVNCGGPRRAGS